jgi:glucosamine 6-phosphate synthetase-like amidotransferase/phosphosugar isomerase protein
MCAIFGSTDPSTFEVLYEANKERGNFASSVVRLVDDDQWILKKEGDIDMDKVNISSVQVRYYTGHVQAPTSSMRKWHYSTSHPFESISWMVFHNGVITNVNELTKWCLPSPANPVDTSLIPELLQYFSDTNGDKTPRPVKYIKLAVEMLEGTFALAIIDCEASDIYLVRCGSLLHYNSKGDYSTLPGKGYKEVPEGTILKLNKKTSRFNKVGTFSIKSPFLFI